MADKVVKVGKHWIINSEYILKKVESGYIKCVERSADGNHKYYMDVPNGVVKAAIKEWEGGINVEIE